jgi:formylglycine-generating enzyme required for sulfatase activity
MMNALGMATLVLGVFFAMGGCGAKELTLDLGNNVTMKLVRIPAGKFLMGSPESEKHRATNEVQHEVTISKPFYMGVYEATQAQWQAVMGTNPSQFKGDNRPVEMVSWDDCQSFCNELSAKVGRTIRLPTEAEWEYACRAGTKTSYYFGDDVSQLARYAWYDDNSDMQTHDVGGKIPNAWGLYDMHGNVWEWCQDRYGAYSAGSQTDPTGLPDGSLGVFRGGGSNISAYYCRVAFRGIAKHAPDFRGGSGGFRLALDSE